MLHATTALSSPCVRNCCLNNEDICLGCFRHVNEITAWRTLSEQQRKEVLKLSELRHKQSTNTSLWLDK